MLTNCPWETRRLRSLTEQNSRLEIRASIFMANHARRDINHDLFDLILGPWIYDVYIQNTAGNKFCMTQLGWFFVFLDDWQV